MSTLQLENIGFYWPIYGRGSRSAAHRPYPISHHRHRQSRQKDREIESSIMSLRCQALILLVACTRLVVPAVVLPRPPSSPNYIPESTSSNGSGSGSSQELDRQSSGSDPGKLNYNEKALYGSAGSTNVEKPDIPDYRYKTVFGNRAARRRERRQHRSSRPRPSRARCPSASIAAAAAATDSADRGDYGGREQSDPAPSDRRAPLDPRRARRRPRPARWPAALRARGQAASSFQRVRDCRFGARGLDEKFQRREAVLSQERKAQGLRELPRQERQLPTGSRRFAGNRENRAGRLSESHAVLSHGKEDESAEEVRRSSARLGGSQSTSNQQQSLVHDHVDDDCVHDDLLDDGERDDDVERAAEADTRAAESRTVPAADRPHDARAEVHAEKKRHLARIRLSRINKKKKNKKKETNETRRNQV
ncbi:unnamed protein product [Trichogramma brassicae]|uniref:Uncharacterized protein n=1 Tax=Trichogramma brassicae TaxID=86971 RepID=A0A6H5I0U4_9HYME|nr:unnamed protein product [Trichogramma brassicae]